ncbi:MAG: LUD domain-containing protein [Dysgonamonadaceae bacterium]|jgi:L-lactate dehydrogenase complex protein LldG|nr:LUD domain-containing protein [Dysgonamonadaceae bacterium]
MQIMKSEPKYRHFIENLRAAGGEIVEIAAHTGSIAALFPDAIDFTQETVRDQFSASTSLEDLDKLECVIFEGSFGVAENGAVWLEDKDLPHRILPFITQHLVLRLDSANIVSTMEEAYDRIRLSETGFGVFISGPSKTADIEQSLVYGAHGAVRETVVCYNPSNLSSKG